MSATLVTPAEHCARCGAALAQDAAFCGACGAARADGARKSDRRRFPALILCLLAGVFGAHRFYVGRNASAVAMLLTFGGLGVWCFVDFIMIAVGGFRDHDGRLLTDWE